MAWREGHWRQDPAVVVLTWQGASSLAPCLGAIVIGAIDLGTKSPRFSPPFFLPESFSFSFSFSLGFSFVHFGRPLQSTYWTVKSWILSVDLRELGILSPFLIYFESI
jgi:hypothetical protein